MNYRSKKIILVIPNSRWHGKRPWFVPPYAALLLTAILKKRFAFSVIDANGSDLSEKNVEKQLAENDPDVVMVTAGSVEYHLQAHNVLAISKRACPDAVTIMGGVYPTVLSEEAVKDPNVDWLFLYHAEERIVPFLELVFSGDFEKAKKFPGIAFQDENNNHVENPPDHHIGQVEKMVKPDYSLVDIKKYLEQNNFEYQFSSDRPSTAIITSYGCPYNCLFCASRTISGRRTVYRPVSDILEEIEYLIEECGVGHLTFLDDALLQKRKRVIELLTKIMEKGWDLNWQAATVALWHLDPELIEIMKRSGCEQITVSVESGSQRVLREIIRKPLKLNIVEPIVKKCKDVGISIGANFVIGFPGETWDEIRETFRFAEKCDFDVAHFHIATPQPKTDLYRIAKEQNLLPPDFSFLSSSFLGFCQGFITTDEFTPMELSVLRAYEWDRINFSSPDKIKRVAKIYQTTPEKLNEHRRQTRRKLGLHIESGR